MGAQSSPCPTMPAYRDHPCRWESNFAVFALVAQSICGLDFFIRGVEKSAGGCRFLRNCGGTRNDGST